MSELYRFGVSLEKDLIKRFDELIEHKNYKNRSEALRDLIREDLVKESWEHDKEVAGAITLIYDHHKRELLNTITCIQHDFQTLIMATQHIHLDHNNCLEILAIKGNARDTQNLVHKLKSIKGIKHCTLSMASTGKDI